MRGPPLLPAIVRILQAIVSVCDDQADSRCQSEKDHHLVHQSRDYFQLLAAELLVAMGAMPSQGLEPASLLYPRKLDTLGNSGA